VVPADGCARLTAPVITSDNYNDNTNNTNNTASPWVAVIIRGDCNFEVKVLNAQAAGAAFVLVYNNVATLGTNTVMMSPGDDGGAAVTIPSAFLSKDAGMDLVKVAGLYPGGLPVVLSSTLTGGMDDQDNHWAIIVFIGILAILISSFFIMIFLIVEIYRQRRRRHYRRPKPVPMQVVITLPMKDIVEEDLGEDKNITCAICLDDFEVGSQVRHLPCNHEFHQVCIDPWLMKHNRFCPVCKMGLFLLTTRKSEKQSTNNKTEINRLSPSFS